MSSASNFASVPTATTAAVHGFGRRHTSTAGGDFDYNNVPTSAMHSAPSYNVEHLASFAVGSHFSVLTPSDGVRKLKHMEQNSAICPVPMIFSLYPNRIAVSELNGNLVEEFPMDLVSDPTAHTSSDPRDQFNNMILFVVLEHAVSDGGTVPTELHIFQGNGAKQQRKGKKAKEAAKAVQNGILQLRAQMPTQDEFVDIFQKFKLCFNLLAKLKNHIHEPSSPELIHFLFTPLTVLLDACHWGLGQQVAQQVCSPLLSSEACELLQVYLFPKEAEVWHALGRAWNTPPEEWPGTLPPPYRPVFSDGWAPYGYPTQNIAPAEPSVSSASLNNHNHHQQTDQRQQQQQQKRFGAAPAIHRGFSVPVQTGGAQSRFYYEPSRTINRDDPSLHREQRRPAAPDNIELERISLEKERLELERRKVLDKERMLMEQERRLREEAEKLEHERRQLHRESEKHSIAGSEPLPDLYRGHSSLQPSPSLNRRSGSSVHLLHNGQSPPSFSSTSEEYNGRESYRNEGIRCAPGGVSSNHSNHFSPSSGTSTPEVIRERRVTYDRAAQNAKELTVARGEILEVINDSKNWWECRNINSRSGYVPHTILTVLDEGEEYNGRESYRNEGIRCAPGGVSSNHSNHFSPSSGTSTPEVIRERRGRNGEFRYF
uniref:SH3 domain-containing protein n=1 Tax=Globodera pallida TaxID=36090 RepID=A0A183BR56_GLOPA